MAKLVRKDQELKIKNLVSKALRFAKFQDVELDYSAEPEICGYSVKGKRLLRRAEAVILIK